MRFLYLILILSFPIRASVTVSGISSGAYMAQQFHTAYSSSVSGLGMVAGGPYYCAKGRTINALNRCMKTYLGLPQIEDSLGEARRLSSQGLIDPIQNLAQSRVYVIAGTNDKTVYPVMGRLTVDLYQAWGVSKASIMSDFDIPSGHTFPTDHYGGKCEVASEKPWISNCGRDVAGEILNHLLGALKGRVSADPSRIFSFYQLKNISEKDREGLSMHETGYVYMPKDCENPDTACRIHVAFHGCKQTQDQIGKIFVENAGYNDWAESNQLIVLYPQAKVSQSLGNPNGCWDWWGYTDSNYHTKEGAQMKLISKLIDRIRKRTLPLR